MGHSRSSEIEVAALIRLVRGQKVMIDRDLARLYEVEVKALNQAVKRNISRFPDDFMFQSSAAEAGALGSQNVTLDVTTLASPEARIGFAPWEEEKQ